MNRYKSSITLLLTFALGAGMAFARKPKTTHDELAKQATVTKEQATATALAKVPNGTIKESELEKEHGKLVWSFDIASPGSADITEVQVDAKTGKIVSVEKESAQAEKNEKKAERK